MARPTEDDARRSTGRMDPAYRDYAASETTPNPDDDPATGEVPFDEVSLSNRGRLAREPEQRGRAPERLVDEDQAAGEPDADDAILQDGELREASEDRIGAGRGLDEAEMGRAKPLDKKPWDGKPNEPYGTD